MKVAGSDSTSGPHVFGSPAWAEAQYRYLRAEYEHHESQRLIGNHPEADRALQRAANIATVLSVVGREVASGPLPSPSAAS